MHVRRSIICLLSADVLGREPEGSTGLLTNQTEAEENHQRRQFKELFGFVDFCSWKSLLSDTCADRWIVEAFGAILQFARGDCQRENTNHRRGKDES